MLLFRHRLPPGSTRTDTLVPYTTLCRSARGSDGLSWVTIAAPHDPVVDRLQSGPLWLRRAATRLPVALQPKPKRTVRVQAYDVSGRLVRDPALDTPDFHLVNGVPAHEGRIWPGSLPEPANAVVDSCHYTHRTSDRQRKRV